MKSTPLSYTVYRNIFTFPIKDYYSKAGVDFSKYSFEEVGRQWINEYERRRLEGSLYAGAEEIIRFITDNGQEQSILSSLFSLYPG